MGLLLPLRIRPACIEDCGFLWVWANDPEVRKNSFNSNPISWMAHVHWFHKKMGDGSTLIYIVTDGAYDPIGVVRFEGAQPEISVTVSEQWRGRGKGAEIIQIGSDQIETRPILARIKHDNIASVKAFRKAGYQLIGTTEQIVYMHLTNSSK